MISEERRGRRNRIDLPPFQALDVPAPLLPERREEVSDVSCFYRRLQCVEGGVRLVEVEASAEPPIGLVDGEPVLGIALEAILQGGHVPGSGVDTSQQD